MDPHEWWKRYIETMLGLPYTGSDPDELEDMLRRAGYFEPGREVPRPDFMPPEETARQHHRLRYDAPDEAREAASTWFEEHGGDDPTCSP